MVRQPISTREISTVQNVQCTAFIQFIPFSVFFLLDIPHHTRVGYPSLLMA